MEAGKLRDVCLRAVRTTALHVMFRAKSAPLKEEQVSTGTAEFYCGSLVAPLQRRNRPAMQKMRLRFTKRRTALIILLALSILFTLLARLVFVNIVYSTIETRLKQNLVLRNGTESFKGWVNPPVPLAFKMYFFDVVNHREVLADSAAPVVIEKGPYVYSMHLHKTDIKFHPNNTVQYRQPESFVFNREASVGPDTDTFTSINVPFLTVANFIQYQPALMQNAVDALFEAQGEGAFVTKSVHDICWGYEDRIMWEIAEMFKRMHINKTVSSSFGFFLNKNNTDDGLYNIYSGQNGDFSNFEMVDRWNGLRKLSIWNSDYANRIYGTDSSVQPPPIHKHDNLTYFDTNMPRTSNLVYQRETSVSGVDTLRFVVPFSDFASAKDNPLNAGFCTPDVSNCLPSGALNVSINVQGCPMVLSFPHFVGGDPYYQEQVIGLAPSPEKHQTFFDYHSFTGLSLRSNQRYQISMKTKPYKHIRAFQNFPDAYLPIFWIDAAAQLDEPTLHLFKTEIQNTLDALGYVKTGLEVLLCFQGVIALSLLIYWLYKDKKSAEKLEGAAEWETNPLLSAESEETNERDNDNVLEPSNRTINTRGREFESCLKPAWRGLLGKDTLNDLDIFSTWSVKPATDQRHVQGMITGDALLSTL